MGQKPRGEKESGQKIKAMLPLKTLRAWARARHLSDINNKAQRSYGKRVTLPISHTQPRARGSRGGRSTSPAPMLQLGQP